jgi:signal transduction histidine kinase
MALEDKYLVWKEWLVTQRNRIIDMFLGVGIVFGSVVMLNTANRLLKGGQPSLNTYIYIISYLILLVLFIFKRIPIFWRSLGMLVLITCFAFYSFYAGWLVSSGRVFFIALVAVSGILISPEAAIVSAVVSFLVFTGFGVAYNQKWLLLASLPDPTSGVPVLIEGVGFAMALALVAVSQWFYGQALKAAAEARKDAKEAQDLLADRAHRLEEANTKIIQRSDALSSAIQIAGELGTHLDPQSLIDQALLMILELFHLNKVTLILHEDINHPEYQVIKTSEESNLIPDEPLPVLTLPLLAMGKTIGFIQVEGKSITKDHEANRSVLQLLSSQLAQAIQNARLYTELHDRSNTLAATNQELESFSFAVSHDLRAPLRSIDGFSVMLLEENRTQLDEMGIYKLERIRLGVNRMKELIEGLLRLSRLWREQMHITQVDLGVIAQEQARMLQENEPARKVRFSINQPILVKGDLTLLNVIMQNLLENAWKFTSSQEDAEIEVGEISIEGKQVIFVKDNGVGFEPEECDRIFGAFHRLHRVDEYPGLGIGLATVQRIVRRHSGRVWAKGQPGQGATFFFTI